MKNYRQLLEGLPSKTVVFAFGRFNPPTIGHELLFKVVKKVAASNKADHVIYASKTQDKKKNPLSVDRKVHYLNLMFPQTNFVAANEHVRTFIEAAKLLNKKYKNLIMIAGSDRVPDYTKLLNQYNGKEFHFDSVQVISAGERDPDSDDATGMSASKMRAAAVKGDYSTFKKGLPSSVRDIDGKLLMNEIRQGMGLEVVKEQIKFDVDTIREQYFRKEIFNIGEFVESKGIKFEIVDRGSNYLTVVDSNGDLSKKWIQECVAVESIDEDIAVGYAPQEISFKGYTTKNLHHSGDAAKAFQATIERYGKHDPVAVLNALKATDTYMKLNDMHLEQGKAPDITELKSWREAHNKAREALQRIGEFNHHQDYWHNHETELQGMEADYVPATAGADMADSYTPEGNMLEELTSKTIKPNDKLKVARIIASFLSVENAEQLSNAEQIINMGLRKVKTKALNKDSLDMLHKMLKLADEVNIEYDTKLVPSKLKESIDSRVTVDPNSGYNAAKDVMRYTDFKKLMKMNKGVVEAKKAIVTDDDDMDPFDYDDKAAPESPPDETKPDTGKAPSAEKIAYRDLENKGPIDSEVGSTYGHGNDSQLRRRKISYQHESVELPEDVATADYKVNPDTGRKSRAHIINFANSKAGGKPDDTPSDKEDESEYKRTNKKMAENVEIEEAKKKKIDSPVKADLVGGGAVNHGFDAFFKEEEEHEDISEKDLDKMVDDIKDVEDIIDAYDDEELAIVDDEGVEIEKDLKEETLNEVLSRMERIRAKVRFARTSAKRERSAKLALKRHSTTTTINSRARHLAVKLLKQRIAKKPLNKLSIGEKERIEKIIQKRKSVINRLAMKLAPRVRKIENDRLAHNKYTKK
jgi:nicotinic acid mononucleotide adenylyltransferase